jgi:hypothetical protein
MRFSSVPRWVLHAIKEGEIVALYPTRDFPETYQSKLELLDTLRKKLDADRRFAMRWYGYVLLPLDISDGVVVNTIPDLKHVEKPWLEVVA